MQSPGDMNIAVRRLLSRRLLWQRALVVHTTNAVKSTTYRRFCSYDRPKEGQNSASTNSEAERTRQDTLNAETGKDGWVHFPSGLKYREQLEGGGKVPIPGELVKVHYSALILETDTLYESTYQSQYPLEFRLNDGSAIRGINEGVTTMKEGGRRLLYVPPHLGYGRFSSPPNITLLIEMELIQVGPDMTWWQKLRSLFS